MTNKQKQRKTKQKKFNSGNSGTSLFISIFQLKMAVIDKLTKLEDMFTKRTSQKPGYVPHQHF